jgi:hypothetical protein
MSSSKIEVYISTIKTKKAKRPFVVFRIPVIYRDRSGFSALLNGFAGACVRTGTAVDAGIRIDHIFAIALGNRFHGAFAFARATGDTRIRNDISH